MANYRIHSAIVDGTPCALQTSSLAMDPQIEEVINSGDSTLAIALITKIPHRVTLGTTDIKKLQKPKCGPVTLFYVCDDDCGNPTAAEFISIAIDNALIYPLRISGRLAQLTMEIVPLSPDGITCPVTLGTTPGPAVSISSVWRPCNGTISEQSLDFGYSYQFPESGGIYQTEAFFEKQVPKATYTTRDKDEITQARLCGKECATLEMKWCEIFKCAATGGTCTATIEGTVSTSAINADVGQPGTSSITVYGEGGVTLV